MSDPYVARHRALPTPRSSADPGRPTGRQGTRRVRRAAGLGGTAAVLTAVAVGAGVVSGSAAPTADETVSLVGGTVAGGTPERAAPAPLTQAELDQREERASRSTGDRRPVADASKRRTLSNASGRAVTRTEDLSKADPKALTRALLPQFGMSASDFTCIDSIWTQESGWNVHADNPTSSAYGIPQALPGSKMASAGPNWPDNAETQIRWGLGYLKARYGSACAAWSFKQSHGWY